MRQLRDKKTFKHKNLIISLCAGLLLILLLGGAAAYTVYEGDSDRIIRNVYIDNIRVGGMKTAEAADTLNSAFAKRGFTVILDENVSREFTAEEMGLMYRTDVLVGEAFSVGKSGSFAKKFGQVFASFLSPVRLSSCSALERAGQGEALSEFAEDYRQAPTDSTFEIGSDAVKVKNGLNGREVDVDKLLSIMESADSYDDIKEIQAPINIIPFVLPDVDAIYQSAASDPRPPYGRNSDGDITATVRVFNLDIARQTQSDHALEGEEYEFPIDTEGVAVLDSKAVCPDTIGSMTISLGSFSSDAAHNITLAAKLLNGADLLPGEEISLNERIGEYTSDNGYKAEGVGVGCVAGALYNAALKANLPILKRYSGDYAPQYLPLGFDAEVSGSKDLKFSNNYDSPIIISANVSSGSLTVEISGRESDRFTDVELSCDTLSVTEYKTKEIVDNTLKSGERVTVESGQNGYVVESFRTVSKNGVEIKRESLGKSTYKAVNKVVKVGKSN